ncbi:MAG: hypothetical protein K5769_04850 [Pseudobutyrivibrio sp.]|nr:hypothetical protein [Pseudobutyrivibrio sp.]
MKNRLLAVLSICIISFTFLVGCTKSGENATNTIQTNSEATGDNVAASDGSTQSTSEGGAESTSTSADASDNQDSNKPADEKAEYAEPSGKEISVDAATRKKMNVFLSNFSEAGLKEYDESQKDFHSIFIWAHTWVKINKNEYLKFETLSGKEFSDYEKITLENINTITDKYFGFTITDEQASTELSKPNDDFSFHKMFYENGALYTPAGDGESYTGLSLISKVEDLGDNKLKLYFNEYSQDLDAYYSNKEIDYSQTQEEADKNPEYEKLDAGYAVVRVENNTYKLEHLGE